jgi:protein tyrosine/serine phosphatase
VPFGHDGSVIDDSVTPRHLDWDGCFNVRDLGGHRTADGRQTRWGAVVRSDSPARLTEAGWASLREHGVRTIVDLRHDSERADEQPPADVDAVPVSILDFDDAAFWKRIEQIRDTRTFYRSVLDEYPDRFAAAATTIARAPAGGVLVHCAVGRDRTGLLTALLLSLVGVPADAIAADYAASSVRLAPLIALFAERAAEAAERERLYRENDQCRPDVLLALLKQLDARVYLCEGGASDADLDALERRLVA